MPEEYVSALRGDGHDVVYSREISELGPEATDDAIAAYAESEAMAIITTDVKDFADRDAVVPVFVAPQDMTGGASVQRSHVSRRCRSIRRRRSRSGSRRFDRRSRDRFRLPGESRVSVRSNAPPAFDRRVVRLASPIGR
ncbi:DUF5615 family PIN-like protein [Halorubrum yunnanense]|uniref:DUF5615 family PIN-like protein n=1 Tax=Halorubrum yunnanense TaxID=1526162 RepID=A0ABD5YDT8_9EURY